MMVRRGYDLPVSEPVIFALTLRGMPSRGALIRSQLDRIGHPYEIFHGTDSYAPGALSGIPATAGLKEQHPGLVGCAWSHWRIAAEIVSRGLPYGIIVEDDAVLTCSRRELEDSIEDIPRGYDMAVLHRSSWAQPQFAASGHTRQWMKCLAPSQGTQFFILSQKGARRLMRELLPISDHIDMWLRDRRDWVFYQHRTGLASHTVHECAGSRETSGGGIPRAIHQIWLGGSPMPERMQRWGRTWDAMNERNGYRRFVWSEDDFEAEMPDVWRRCRGLSVVMQSDILRLAILHRRGGVYVDTDFECLREITPLMQGSLIWGEEVSGVTSTGFMASVRDHPLVGAALDEALSCSINPGPVNEVTGPGLLRRVAESMSPGLFADDGALDPVHAFGGEVGGRHEDILRLNAATIYPYYIGEAWRRELNEQAFAVHHWEASWWPEAQGRTESLQFSNHD